MINLVEHWDPEKDGSLTEEKMRSKLESRGYSVNKYVYPPGTFFPEHTHNVDKIDAVLSGIFRLSLRGQEVILHRGDCLEVPRGILHSAEVIGNEPVISLDAIKT